MKSITIIPLIFLSFNWLIISFVAAKFTHNIVSLDDLSLLNPQEFTSIEVKASVFSIIICPPLFNLMLGFNNALIKYSR